MANVNCISNDVENMSLMIAESITLEIESLPPSSSTFCISQVPTNLKLKNENLYVPRTVSIGPFHHGKDNLKPMEDCKKMYLKYFLERTKVNLDHFVRIIIDKEAKIRESYSEHISCDEFVKMVLIDSTFLIEIMLRSRSNEPEDRFNKSWILKDLFPDFCLLENQLPFFILEDIFNIIPWGSSNNMSMTKLLQEFFYVMLGYDEDSNDLETVSSSKILHFVDFKRKLHIPPKRYLKCPRKLKTLSIPTISELCHAGVRLKPRSTKNLFDVRFSNGVLEFPVIVTNPLDHLIWRNVLAFEQKHCTDTYLNDYFVLINRLIVCDRDIELLIKNGILENNMGSVMEVSNGSRKIADALIINQDEFYFADVCEELRVYCRSPWNTWKANLGQKYLYSPWVVVFTLAASFLIIRTIINF